MNILTTTKHIHSIAKCSTCISFTKHIIYMLLLTLPIGVFAGASLPTASLSLKPFPSPAIPDLSLSKSNIPKLDSISSGAACGSNPQAKQLAQLIISSTNQQRQSLTCNHKLNEIARIKVDLLRNNQNVWHDMGRLTPNQLLRHNGFKLPSIYPLIGNQVEAIAGGMAGADTVFEGFLNSPGHRQLLLGEDQFYQAQDQIGVAYVKDLSTEHEHYWVVIIATEKTTHTPKGSLTEVKPEPLAPVKKTHRRISAKERMYQNKVRSQWDW